MTIHERALEIAGRFKRSSIELIEIIQDIDSARSYREKDFGSTHEYCLKYLKLSADVAYNFITVARKSKEVPELKAAIREDLITVSNAKKIVSVINPENKTHWLQMAQSLPKAKLEKEIAKINPQTATPEKIKYVSETRLKLELGISEEVMNDLKRAQDVLSQKMGAHASLEDVLGRSLKEFLRKEDPLKKAQRVGLREEKRDRADVQSHKRSELVPGPVELIAPGESEAGKADGPRESRKPRELSEPAMASHRRRSSNQSHSIPYNRGPLNARLTRQVTLRDQAQCTHITPTGERCLERKWLAVHHIIPISQGGQDELPNLKTLCFAHHQLAHEQRSNH